MRPLEIAACVLLVAGLAAAQRQGGTPSTTAPAPATGTNPGRTPNTPNNNSPFPDSNGLGQRPIFISGKVVLSDGTPLPDRVKIERVCNGTPRLETYTDRKGRFSFEVGRNLEMQDASSSSSFPDGFPGARSGGSSSQLGSQERSLWGCELRAALPGYRSDQLSLSNIHYMDNPEVGTIILHPLGKVDGLTISVNSALAPNSR